jgi:hypothetical protein
MKIIAFVVQASEIKKILAYVSLPTESPKVHPARGPPQGDLWQGDLFENETSSESGVHAMCLGDAD